jgi:hypothetical protein
VRCDFKALVTIVGNESVRFDRADFGSVTRNCVRTFRHSTRNRSSSAQSARLSGVRAGVAAIFARTARFAMVNRRRADASATAFECLVDVK